MPTPDDYYRMYMHNSYKDSYQQYKDAYEKWSAQQQAQASEAYQIDTLVVLQGASDYLGKIVEVNLTLHKYQVLVVHIKDGARHGVHGVFFDGVQLANIDKLVEHFGISNIARAILKL